MSRSFNLTDTECARYEKWWKKHKDKCPYKKFMGAIGGRTSFIFTPTSLGSAKIVQCACGAAKDITDR